LKIPKEAFREEAFREEAFREEAFREEAFSGHKSTKDIQYNGQKTNDKIISNNLQNTKQKIKD
jgi:hypothetical protein